MWEETDIGSQLVAKVNVTSTDLEGDGLYVGQNTLCSVSDDNRNICVFVSKDRGPIVTKEILSKRWGIDLNMAHQTLQATTQKGVQQILHPVECHYKTKQTHLSFPTLRTKFYTY
jgi:hypothetical protein